MSRLLGKHHKSIKCFVSKTKITAAILLFLCSEMVMYSQTNASNLPESYDFTWRYTQQIVNKEGTMLMHYYFKEGQLNFGTRIEMEKEEMAGSMFTITDYELNKSLVLMDMMGNKMGQKMKLPKSDFKSNEIDDYNITEIGEKEILGYHCKGIQYENKDYKMIMYYALEAPVSFNQLFQNESQYMPKGVDKELFKTLENSMLMEMQFTDKKKKKFNSTITCVALEKEALHINISDYKFMGF